MRGSSPLNVGALTADQPFCAGVVLFIDGDLLVTLNADHVPAELEGVTWRVGGVGGGQEPSETIWECALREAAEELLVPVELRPSPVTYLHDADEDVVVQRRCSETIAPILIQRQRRLNPHQPFRPGLPTGPYLYSALFLGELLAEPQGGGR